MNEEYYKPEGKEGIELFGHREYVGGLWDEIGSLQFLFLLQRGLKPHHALLDIGCGCLRGGIHFISYLDPENYLGIDKEKALIQLGIEKELPYELYKTKRPELISNDDFSFTFSKRPSFALAQSVFTHLTDNDIIACLRKLRAFCHTDTRFYATFFPGNSRQNYTKSHSHRVFYFTPYEMKRFGSLTGWKSNFIGDWNHPRNQLMIEYIAS